MRAPRRLQQPLVVGIAADDPVQDDDVGRLNRVRIGGEIVETPLRPLLESGLAQQLPCLVRVRRRQFEVDRALRAPFQQLDLDLAHAPPTSSTLAPSMPPCSRKSTIRRAVLSSPLFR